MPASSMAIKYLKNLHYFDCYECRLPNKANYSHEDASALFFYKWPVWIRFLLWLRGALAKLLNLKHDSEQLVYDKELHKTELKEGSKISIFSVCSVTENELILKGIDTHLSAVLCFYIEKEKSINLTLITLVEFHKTKGRFYFWLIKPFHKLIVKNQLKTVLKYYETNQFVYETV